jgi:hypothetical protein
MRTRMLPKIINFPKIQDPRGNLTFLQHPTQIPFEIKRVFWIYDVPGGETRGGHAYKIQEELIIALSGSFDVHTIDQEGNMQKYSLNRSYDGLYIPAGIWRYVENHSTNALALHLSSTKFSEDDYIRDFEDFKKSL